MRKLIPLILLTFALTGCSKVIKQGQEISQYQYRDISQEEINHFIPTGYSILKDDVYKTPQIIKVNFIQGKDKQIALILVPDTADIYNETVSPKMEILGFDRSSDKWNLLFDVYDFKASNISGFQLTDLDKNGIQELHLLLTLSCGSSCSYHQGVYTINDGNITDLMPTESETNMGFNLLNDGKYLKIDYIWAENESHFGCHYFKVSEYNFDDSKYSLVKETNTKNKYALDEGDSQGFCKVYNMYDVMKEAGY